MRRKWSGLGLVFLLSAATSAQAVCVKNSAEYKAAKEDFPKEFAQLPVYITTDSRKGTGAIKVEIVEGRIKLSAYYRKLFMYGSDDAFINSFCVQDKLVTIDFENKAGERQKEKDFEATYDPESRTLNSALVQYKFSSEADYKAILDPLKSKVESKKGKSAGEVHGAN